MSQEQVLIYAKDGFAWVRDHADSTTPASGHDLISEENPKAIFPTLMDAFHAAVRKGLNPTRHGSPGDQVFLKIDQADHWRSMLVDMSLR